MVYVGLTNLLFLLRYALADAHRLRRQVYYVILLALFLFTAFRWQVGCDWFGYYNHYLIAESIDWSLIISRRDPLWWAILHWIQNMGLPYPVVNIVPSAVFFIGAHVLARRQPDPLGFLVLLFPIFIINVVMTAIRQGAATGLICVAFAAFIDRRPIWFAFWVVLAAGFHSSALVFLLLLPLATGRFTMKRLFFACLLAVPGIALLATGEASELARSRYVETDLEAVGAVFRLTILFLSALYFLVFVRRKWKSLFSQDYGLVSIGAIGMVLAVVMLPVSSVIADRFGYYLIIIQAIIFARLPFLQFRFNQSVHSAVPYLGLLMVFLVYAQLSGHFEQCYNPYQSWIFGIPSGSILK